MTSRDMRHEHRRGPAAFRARRTAVAVIGRMVAELDLIEPARGHCESAHALAGHVVYDYPRRLLALDVLAHGASPRVRRAKPRPRAKACAASAAICAW